MGSLSEYFPNVSSAGIARTYTVLNPEALDGTNNWTGDVGTGIATRGSAEFPSGQVFWGSTQVNGGAYQDVALVGGDVTTEVIDSGEFYLRLRWAYGCYNGSDQSKMLVEFYDGTPGSLLGRDEAYEDVPFLAGPQGISAQPAEYRAIVYKVPVGARTVRLFMRMYRTNGTDNNGYISSITLNGFTGVA